MAKKIQMRVGGNTVTVTNADKMLFPEDGLTKGDLIEYYHRIARVMLPHIQDRPVTMVRYPDGIEGEEIYQQAIPNPSPAWVSRVEVKKTRGSVTHLVCNNAATLVYLANMACITPHTWLSRSDQLEIPDQMIFDLDPPDDDFVAARQGALYLKGLLQDLGLMSFVKTSGSHGLHVIVPLLRREKFTVVRTLGQDIAGTLVKRDPRLFTMEQRKAKRLGRVFIDTLRNSYGATAVAPYAVRAREKAPIATPLEWEELNDRGLTARSYNLRNIWQRLEKQADPWKGIDGQAQSLSQAQEQLKKIAARTH